MKATSFPLFPSIESPPLPPSSVSVPEPPTRVSSPLPPLSVPAPEPPTRIVVSVATVDRRRDAVGEDPVALVDAHEVVTVAGLHGDPRDVRALDVEVGRAVVADVDLEDAGLAGLQPKRDLVALVGALDCQHAVLKRWVVELSVLQ
jgi:hypothetical protein